MRNRTKKFTAWFFLIVFGIETFYPGMAYALTSGPAQPELTKFEPAGTDDMVDLFTGDFKYNIPLVDVGGYPINLAYHSGDGMEDESSWVGFGWTLNPGTINRDMRGLPDDFNGEEVIKTYDRKEFRKIGGEVIWKPSFFAWEIGLGKGSANIKLGIYKDNYYGVGASFGLGANQTLTGEKKTKLTAGLELNSDNREGATFSPSLSLSRQHDAAEDETVRSLSGSLAYNTRAGLKQVDLSASWSTSKKASAWFTLKLSATKFFGQSYTPSFNTNTSSNGFTLNVDGGVTVFGAYQGIGGSGYSYSEKIINKTVKAPAYGYMNYVNGRKLTNALLDFNRENDGVYIPGTPSLPVPVPTYDLFMATGQAGSGQFRPFFNGNYVVFDKAYSNSTLNASAGVTLGGGNLTKTGGRIDYTSGGARTGKWLANNHFLEVGEPDFNMAVKPGEEAVNFKQTGEITRADKQFLDNIQEEKTVQVVTNDKKHMFSTAKTWSAFKVKDGGEVSLANKPLKKGARDKRATTISYLNADTYSFALDKKINGEDRITSIRRPHHLSEITVTDNGGQRMVYGIPVYNTTQCEASFSVDKPQGTKLERALKAGLVEYTAGVDNSVNNEKGRDNLFTKDVVPAYATSFLLTGILSPDYVDVKNDGISDDDLGTAYKFNYTRTATPSNPFKWRAPYAANTANYNQGFVSDNKDDKASYTYGEKELWYLNGVESKTMIAFFIMSDREDGLGVLGENGGKNTAVKLKKLDRIELYSKADWERGKITGQPKAVPVKVVHFEYDYTTHPGVPNNTGAVVNVNGVNVNDKKGKLTLKKIYFTFGNNKRGQSNPYEFSYDQRKVSDVFSAINPPPASYQDPVDPTINTNPEASNNYTTRQADRWGTYKPNWYNRLTGTATDGKLDNSEFPYAIQDNENGNAAYDDRKLANLFASMWQLNKIVTPTGSTINVEYEADDYAFVQNRRAMQMCFVKSLGKSTSNIDKGMMGSHGFTVELPKPITSLSQTEFKRKYLTGADGKEMSRIYYKINTDLNKKGKYEFVHGYADIDISGCELLTDKTAFIKFTQISGVSPVSRAAWQKLKTDLPQFAYNNYDNSDVSFTSAAIKSLFQSVVNMREYFQPFENRAKNQQFADDIDLTKSMIRLYSPDNKKMGGGARVRKLTIEDAWHDMSHNTGITAKYGQLYEYETKDQQGNPVSTGVAAYEPQIGNEENPFHEPDPFTEKVHWAPDKHHFVDLPYCETFFPPASVGYSKVTVTNFGDTYAQGGALEKFSGYVENEFYTAKDFPTYVDYMPLEATNYENGMLLKLFSFTSIKRMTTSQGFKIELNDMHGKPKAVKVFDQGGNEISSAETFYNVDDERAVEKRLNNNVDVVEGNTGGKIETAVMGTDIDMATDVRESTNETVGKGLGAYVGTMMTFLGPWPYLAVNGSYSRAATTYHSASIVKVVHKYGIVKKVRTTKNGSSIEAENLLWDGETGAVLLTKTQNEFNDYIYSFTYPAYWAEGQEGMGGAYKNTGAVLINFITETPNIVPDNFKSVVFPGDELAFGDTKSWVIRTSDGKLRLIDADGNPVAANGNYVVVRSGKRNMMGASAGSITCLNNPVVGTGANRRLQFNVGNKILDAKAVLYSDEWGVPVANKFMYTPTCNPYGSENTFSINKQSIISCNTDFAANASPTSAVRSFMNFPTTANIPAGAIINSATLTLYPKGMSGSNSSLLYRVKETVTCYTEGVGWSAQPVISESYPVSLPVIPNTVTDAINLDVTAMVNEWHTLKDNPLFGISIRNVNDLVPLAPRNTTFYGSNAGHLGRSPSLQICYQIKQCVDPVNQNINPYFTGVLGNWRPKQNFVYMVDREQKPGLTTQPGGTNIRNSGGYVTFNPFWEFRSLGGIYSNVPVNPTLATERWVWASKSIYYDQKGNEIESSAPIDRDRQGNIDITYNAYRYNSALYGYRESLPVAVVNNARHNEIAFDGFEDYYFTLQNVTENCPLKRHFDWGLSLQQNVWKSGSTSLVTDNAHSGKYSMLINGSMSVTKPLGSNAPAASMLSYNNSNGNAVLMANELAKGFTPLGNDKKYLLSMWVKDGNQNNNTIAGLNVSLNSQQVDMSKPVPVVEGWKLLTVPFTSGTQFSLQLSGSGVYIDDVRIFPNDANMNSYVYDDRTMRLMAQLDENNFATFYEYDDEGTPIRVKKETERGIMTLKENRQSFRQR